MSSNYGVLRVVRVLPATATTPALSGGASRTAVGTRNSQEKRPTGWLPEEGLVHVLTRLDTSIGRALDNDVILMDPTVSREHARLLLDAHGWHIVNLTTHNVVRVNGRPVPAGGSLPVESQDILVLGSTMLQLIAPQDHRVLLPNAPADDNDADRTIIQRKPVMTPPAPTLSTPSEWTRQLSGRDGNGLVSPAQEGREAALDDISAHSVSTPPELPVQLGPEENHLWNEAERESILGAGITMQFALPQRMGARTRWLIVGIGIAILTISAMITIILNSVIGLAALAQNGAASVVGALIIPLIPAVGIFLLVNFMDRFEREPWYLRLAAFLWGAIIAIPPALFIEQKVDAMLQAWLTPTNVNEILRIALQGLNAGITEETIKGLGLILLFFILRDEFDNVTDGIVYGALIGAGFAMVENFSYFALNSKHFLVFLIVGRILLGWLGHSTFIACFGAGLGYIRHTHVRWKQIVIPLIGYLIAVGLHSFFDFVDLQASVAIQGAPNDPGVVNYALGAIIGNYIPPFLAQLGLLYVLIKGLAHEAAVIREFLAVEVSNGVVMVDEYALLQNSFVRTKQERRVLRRSGIRQWLRVKALYQTEIGLAFRKWHVSMGDKPKLGFLQPEDAYRQRIRRLRNEIRAADMQPT